jgi:SRSO17 transposase
VPAARSRTGRPRTRPQLPPGTEAVEARVWAATQPPRAWRLVSWRNGTHPPWRARFCATRVTPAHDWRERRLAPEVWLLCERDLGAAPRTKHHLVHLPPTASLRDLVHLAHQRWAIEQHYQHLKTELGLDHFEGRTYPGWQHHMVISAIAYEFLQRERMHGPVDEALTFPALRAIVQEVFTGLLFASRPTYVKWLREAQATYHLRI